MKHSIAIFIAELIPWVEWIIKITEPPTHRNDLVSSMNMDLIDLISLGRNVLLNIKYCIHTRTVIFSFSSKLRVSNGIILFYCMPITYWLNNIYYHVPIAPSKWFVPERLRLEYSEHIVTNCLPVRRWLKFNKDFSSLFVSLFYPASPSLLF